MGVIYKIQHKESGKIYIGQTRRALKQRIKEHLRNKQHYHIGNALNKYGIDAFDVSIVEITDDNLLNEREKYWIKYYDCVNPKGYNNTYGGEGGVMSKDAKYKISNSLKEYYKTHDNPMSGTVSPMRGKVGAMKGEKHKSETIQKMKEQRTGENSKIAKPIICVETNKYYISAKEASDYTGINRSCLCDALKGKQKTAGKLHLRYATEQEILLHKKGA